MSPQVRNGNESRSSPQGAGRRSRCARRGLTLIELLFVSALGAGMLAAVAMMLRTSHDAWRATEADQTAVQQAHATVRHLMRNLRQAQSVTAITPEATTSGSLSVLMPSGATFVWAHVSPEVRFGPTTATNLLATNINELRFVGYRGDGVTKTTVPAEIRGVQCIVTVTLPRSPAVQRTVTGWAWVRAW